MAIWPFRPSPTRADAEQLLDGVIKASRNPAFFGAGRVPDSLGGRFEVVTLHAALALVRLREADAPKGLAQHFTDVLFKYFDSGLREAGVGDLAVPKRMFRMASDFYGRLNAYAQALDEGEAALADAIGRNALPADDGFAAAKFAQYALALRRRQQHAPASELATADAWDQPLAGFGF